MFVLLSQPVHMIYVFSPALLYEILVPVPVSPGLVITVSEAVAHGLDGVSKTGEPAVAHVGERFDQVVVHVLALLGHLLALQAVRQAGRLDIVEHVAHGRHEAAAQRQPPVADLEPLFLRHGLAGTGSIHHLRDSGDHLRDAAEIHAAHTAQYPANGTQVVQRERSARLAGLRCLAPGNPVVHQPADHVVEAAGNTGDILQTLKVNGAWLLLLPQLGERTGRQEYHGHQRGLHCGSFFHKQR